MNSFLDQFRRKASPSAIVAIPHTAPAKVPTPSEPAAVAPPMGRALDPVRHKPAATGQPKPPPGSPGRKATTEMLTLTLGDILDRIPDKFLCDGRHDRSIPLPFDLAVLSERLGCGESKIPLKEIYRMVPDIFRTDAVIGVDIGIRFPWRKVLTLLAQSREGAAAPGLTTSGAETLALKLKARKFRRPPKMAALPRPGAPVPDGTAKNAKKDALPTLRALPAPTNPKAPAALRSPVNPPKVQEMPADSASAAALKLERIKAGHTRQFAALAAEWDWAVAEIGSLRKEVAAHSEQLALERCMAAEVGGSDRTIEALKAERDTALARAAEFGGEYESMVARTGALIAARDAVAASAAELAVERDAILVCAAKLTEDSDAALARNAELIAERDAALARTAELTAERDAWVTYGSELVKYHEAALAHAGKP